MKSPFCKVCFDTGKPDSLYNSHYVKDVPGMNGIIVCPTLLALECRYCKQAGHTVSRCPLLKQTQNNECAKNKFERRAAYHAVKYTTPVVVPNRFEALESDKSFFRARPPLPPTTTAAIKTYPSYATVVVATKPTEVAVVAPKCCAFQHRSPSNSPPPLRWSDSTDSNSDDDDDDDDCE